MDGEFIQILNWINVKTDINYYITNVLVIWIPNYYCWFI